MDVSHYEKIKTDAEVFYNGLKPCFCLAVESEVRYPSESFNHIVYRGARNERSKEEQIMRFKLLPKAVELIAIATVYQEYEETLKEVSIVVRGKQTKRVKTIQYWGLIGIIGSHKIKVILRKIGEGNIHFWSVIPAWVTNKHRDIKFMSTMKGDPEID